MNNYLESLILIDEHVDATDCNSADQESNEVDSNLNSLPTTDSYVTENGDPSVVTKEEPAQLTLPESISLKSTYEIGQTYPVVNIRVFNTPDRNQVSKLISGNVVYLGQIDEYYIIKYMKHGFGLIKGYTLSLS